MPAFPLVRLLVVTQIAGVAVAVVLAYYVICYLASPALVLPNSPTCGAYMTIST